MKSSLADEVLVNKVVNISIRYQQLAGGLTWPDQMRSHPPKSSLM